MWSSEALGQGLEYSSDQTSSVTAQGLFQVIISTIHSHRSQILKSFLCPLLLEKAHSLPYTPKSLKLLYTLLKLNFIQVLLLTLFAKLVFSFYVTTYFVPFSFVL